MPTNPLAEIQKHKDAIEKLKGEAIDALRIQKTELENQLDSVESQIAELSGETPKAGKTRGPKKAGKLVSADRLKELIQEAHGKVLNIRKAGLDTANIRKLVAEDPKQFAMGPKGPWPLVTLNK